MKRITMNAMAKINLALDVLKRREDGYHEVKMIMQTVELFDILHFEKQEKAGISITIEGADLPADRNNLIYKAANLLYEKNGIQEGVRITLVKQIPIAAGMAGGSTDAAATLTGLNLLFDLGYQEEQLKELGVTLGADIPYCIQGGTVLSEGIGEKLTTLPPIPSAWLVVAKPAVDVSTAYVYRSLRLQKLKERPDIDGMMEAIRQKDIVGVADRLGNVMETVTEREYPVITQLKAMMKENGALNALMSGSGPTVFGIFTKEEQARKAREQIEKSGLAPQSHVTVFCEKAQVVQGGQEE